MNFMCRLIAMMAACLAPTAHAADEPQEVAAGLYEGTIGKLPVQVCFDDGGVTGTYYYKKHLKPIALRPDENDTAGVLEESLGYDAPTGATWHLQAGTKERIAGIWRSADRSLPLRLERVEFTANDFTGPCEAPEFLAPRMRGGEIQDTSESIDGTAYTRLTYIAGSQFNADDVSIASFALIPAQAGDAKINQTLGKVLPDGSGTSNFIQCMGMMHLQWGTDGYFDHQATPELISPSWLGVIHSKGLYCGGAHPNHWIHRQVFDRRTGQEIDPSTWLTEGSLYFYDLEPDAPVSNRLISGASPGLLYLIGEYWPSESEECWSMINEGSNGWDIGLAREGLIFKPDLPHVIAVCAESVTVPWTRLDAFLSDDGKAVRGSLQ